MTYRLWRELAGGVCLQDLTGLAVEHDSNLQIAHFHHPCFFIPARTRPPHVLYNEVLHLVIGSYWLFPFCNGRPWSLDVLERTQEIAL